MQLHVYIIATKTSFLVKGNNTYHLCVELRNNLWTGISCDVSCFYICQSTTISEYMFACTIHYSELLPLVERIIVYQTAKFL